MHSPLGPTLTNDFLCHYEKNWLNTTGASDRSLYPIFNKTFDHLETLLTIHRPKEVWSAGSLCRFLVASPQSKCPPKDLHITPKVSCFSFKYVIIAT